LAGVVIDLFAGVLDSTVHGGPPLFGHSPDQCFEIEIVSCRRLKAPRL
jgi:hypothetical protein